MSASNVVALVPTTPAPEELGEMLAQYVELAENIKAMEIAREDMRKGLLAMLPTGTTSAPGFQAKISARSGRRTFSVKRLLAAHPGLESQLDGFYDVGEDTVELRVTRGK
jgi:hypothetical protein